LALGESGVRSSMSLIAGLALCYSARITLYDNYTCADPELIDGVGIPEQLGIQSVALPKLKDVCLSVFRLSRDISELLETTRSASISPLVGECLYQAVVNMFYYVRETGKQEFVPCMEQIQDTMGKLDHWGLLGKDVYFLHRLPRASLLL
jgi:hypothetical protein